MLTLTSRIAFRGAISASARQISSVSYRGARNGMVASRNLIQPSPAASSLVAKRFISKPAVHGEWNGPTVTYEEVKRKSDQPSPNSYIIDVREPDEVAQGSIPSSVSIPLSTINQSLRLADIDFEAKFGFKKPAKDEEIIFYCRSGKRSASASDEAKQAGFTNIKNYSGSWLDWTAKEQERKTKNYDED